MEWFIFFLYSIINIFIIVNPLSTTSIFLALTDDDNKKEKREIIRGATLISTIVLMLFALVGQYIFLFFGITIGAFKIAGGDNSS
jgi:multiple antibiotic resistance protein